MAAWAMRQVLVDLARKRKTARRGGGDWGRVSVELEEAGDAVVDPKDVPLPKGIEMIDVDAALTRLAGVHAKSAKVVELRYFGGLTIEETAGVLGLSVSAVGKHWRLARAWLGRELDSGGPP